MNLWFLTSVAEIKGGGGWKSHFKSQHFLWEFPQIYHFQTRLLIISSLKRSLSNCWCDSFSPSHSLDFKRKRGPQVGEEMGGGGRESWHCKGCIRKACLSYYHECNCLCKKGAHLTVGKNPPPNIYCFWRAPNDLFFTKGAVVIRPSQWICHVSQGISWQIY